MNDNNKSNNPSDNGGRRGFASMDPNKQREIAAKGGRAAHATGKAHEWNSREAKKAGQLGGRARGHKNSQDQSGQDIF